MTLHLLIDKRREPVRDVVALYLTEPTPDNIARISEDVALGLYDAFHLNFTTYIPRPLLEQLARETVQKQCAQSIACVYDQYCHYVALEPQLFSLNLSNSFSLINTRTTPGSQLDAFVRTVVDGLFSVCVTLVRSCYAHTPSSQLVCSLHTRGRVVDVLWYRALCRLFDVRLLHYLLIRLQHILQIY